MEQRKEHIETLLGIAAGMILFFLVSRRVELLYIGLGISLLGLFSPFLARYIHLGWTGFAKVMGFINGHIILTVIFFLVLTPLALIRRLGSKDLLQLRKKPSGSYYATRDHKYTARDLKNPW